MAVASAPLIRETQTGTSPAPRALTRADLDAYARLFCTVFRGGNTRAQADIAAYMDQCLFASPVYDEACGSVVQEDAGGVLLAAMGFIPIPMIACGREITARLGMAFLTRPGHAGGAGRITAPLRARRQDFVFSSNGAPLTAAATRAGGGQVLPLQSLDFERNLRPCGALLSRFIGRCAGPSRLGGLLLALARPFDALARALRPGLAVPQAPGWRVENAPRALVLEAAPRMVERFAVRPRWAPAELDWQLDLAAAKSANGPLREVAIRTAEGALAGLAFYYAAPSGPAQLLNLLSEKGREREVMRALLAHLDAAGHASLRGEAQPALMQALERERALTYRFRGSFCVLTRHEDVAQAVARGDFYSGGLVGESWSRLVSDFW